uniref:Uncharacterized protein n=1 Tax=Anguilla anguilla TaxID=7936 RepID=A0A0E9XAG8_ANGAN
MWLQSLYHNNHPRKKAIISTTLYKSKYYIISQHSGTKNNNYLKDVLTILRTFSILSYSNK